MKIENQKLMHLFIELEINL